jgi:hypothetical protein
VQAILGAAVERDVDVVKDQREARGFIGHVFEAKPRLDVLGEAPEPRRHDATVLERVGLHHQR